jgi:hypothetical protein
MLVQLTFERGEHDREIPLLYMGLHAKGKGSQQHHGLPLVFARAIMTATGLTSCESCDHHQGMGRRCALDAVIEHLTCCSGLN